MTPPTEPSFRALVEVGREATPPLRDVLRGAYDALEAWSRSLTGVALDVADRLGEDFSVLRGGVQGPSVRCLHELLQDGSEVAGLRFDVPATPERAGVSAEVVLKAEPAASGESAGARARPGRLLLAVRTVGSPDPTARNAIRCPPLVRTLATRYGLRRDGEDLPTEARTLSRAEVEGELVPYLGSRERTAPVVVCSPAALHGRPLIDAGELQDAVLGLAPVFVVESARGTFPIAQGLGTAFACYDGAVRIYFPGAGGGATPGEHPLWTPGEQSEHSDFPGVVARTILERGRGHVDPGMTWEWLAAAGLRRRLGSLKDREILSLLRDREAELDARVREVQALYDEERRKAASLAGEVRALRERLARYEVAERAGAGENGDDPGEAPLTCASIVERVVRRHPERIVLALNSRSELDGYPFEDLDGFAAALDFLATTYWDARLGGVACADLDAALRQEAPGFRYASHQADSTVGRFAADYQTTWEGRAYELRAHLRRGVSRDPRHSVRIAFAVDEERRRVVVGYIGQHQRTPES